VDTVVEEKNFTHYLI
jgi:hypothetical protein